MSAHAVMAPSILSSEGLEQIERALAASSHVNLVLQLDSIFPASNAGVEHTRMDPSFRDAVKGFVGRNAGSVSVLSKHDLNSLRDYVGLEGLIYIARNGMEIETEGRLFRNPDVETARKELRCLCLQLKLALADLGDVAVEEGELGLVVRLGETADDMRDLIARRAEEAIRSRNFFGPYRTQDAVEARLKPKGYAGWAVCCLSRSVMPPDTLDIYLGDHLTVQNIRDATGDGITIEVGNSLSSAAQFALPDTAAVGRFLSWLEHAKPHASISNPLPAGERSALV